MWWPTCQNTTDCTALVARQPEVVGDNCGNVIQCQSIGLVLSLRKWLFSASWRNILRALGALPHTLTGALPLALLEYFVPQTPCQCSSQTKIVDPPVIVAAAAVCRLLSSMCWPVAAVFLVFRSLDMRCQMLH